MAQPISTTQDQPQAQDSSQQPSSTPAAAPEAPKAAEPSYQPKDPSAEAGAADAAKAAAAAAEAEWKANLTYEVSKQKKEFDPVFKEVVKNQEIEKKLRELYEKSDGIEIVKQSRDVLRQRYEQVQKHWEPVQKDLQTLGKFMKSEDFDNVFKMLNIPEQKVVDWVASKIQYTQMSPEERARVDALRKERGENYKKSDEVETLSQRLEQQEVEYLTFQLDMLKETQKFADAAAAFDQRVGKPGAFEDKLFEMGDFLSSRNGGKTVPPKMVFDHLVREYGLEGQAATPAAPPQSRTVVTTPPVEKPTITQVRSSKTATPVKRQFRSIDELKKHQQELSGAKIEPGAR